MITASILLKTYGMLLWGIHRPTAVACWLLSLGLDVAWTRRLHRKADPAGRGWMPDLLLLQGGALVLGPALLALFQEATTRWKDGLPLAARAVTLLTAALRLPMAAFAGDAHVSTMAGPLAFHVNLDTLGAFPVMLVGGFGMVYLLMGAPRADDVARGAAWIGGVLLGAMLLHWVLSTALFLALCDFVSHESDDLPMAPFFKPWMSGLLYLPIFLVAGVILHPKLEACTAAGPRPPRGALPRRPWAWVGLLALCIVVSWAPAGRPRQGAVVINTYHAKWSPTARPYDRDWYGAASGYNYACLKRLFEGFFTVREVDEPVTPDNLEDAGVLMIYGPDRPFAPDELRAIWKFVEQGGGLLLVGDHTNVFGSSSHLNQVARPFGFQFRDDVLFDLDADFFQLIDIPSLHPEILHGMSFFKFRGPGSVRSRSWFTRDILRVGNAKSLRAIYSVNNFYPPPHDDPKMRTGLFSVSMTARHGRGRVLAFADSTIFSNFEIFYPGKYEYLLNAMRWLDRVDAPLTTPVKRVSLVGAILLLGVLLRRARTPRGVLGVLLAALVTAGVARTLCAVAETTRGDFPRPARPLRFLFFASTPDEEAYRLRAFTTDTPYEQKFDVFIQWVLRTDVFPGFYLYGPHARNPLYDMLAADEHADAGLALIASRPEHLDQLADLGPGPMAETRRLLLLFAKRLPWDDVKKTLEDAAIFSSPDAMAEVEAAWPAGEARLEDGDRRIAVVFSAERFSDRHMGFSEKVKPNTAQRTLYGQEFDLLDWLFDQTPPDVPASPGASEFIEVE